MGIWALRHLLALIAGLAVADAWAAEPVQVQEIGHLYVGGQTVQLRNAPPRARVRAASLPPAQVDPNGDFVVGGTYVGFVRLAHPSHGYPILMMPGGGLSGAVYETTPDGRPGWEWFFLRAGYSTDIADLDQTGRSGWARYPEIDPDEPAFRANDFIWEVFRIGPPGSYARAGGPTAFPGTQFPADAFTTFARQVQPRFGVAAEAEARAFDAIIKAVCPCILLTHSASGQAGLGAAQRSPALVKAVVSIEPSAVPGEAPAGGTPPELFVWGDFLGPGQTDPDWAHEVEASQDYFKLLQSRGVSAEWVSLPARGIKGNSHMMMLDRNSDTIARLVDQWISAQGL